jgi:hypothetical protein
MAAYTGTALPLSSKGFAAAQAINECEAAALWSVLSVETSGCGYLNDRRPKILFERHFFSRLTHGKFDLSHPDISAPSAGGYGESGGHQYLRLGEAVQLDNESALRSASWGLGQIMGDNCKAAGFPTAAAMVTAMVASEDAQLKAVAAFIKANGMGPYMRNRDWANFARRYNGPNYAQNHYDTKLAQFYEKYSTGPMPDLMVRAAQVYLTFKGYNPGPIDGLKGQATTDAVIAFQRKMGLPASGLVDEKLLAALAKP